MGVSEEEEEGVAADGGSTDGTALAEARIVVQGQVMVLQLLCLCNLQVCC